MAPRWRITSPETPVQFAALYDLRWRLLRAPWGQPRGSERDALDAGAIHAIALTDAGRIIGIARLHRLDATTGQIRYMAVVPEHRGEGIGSALLQWLEARARETGLSALELNAREGSVAFYRRHGYRTIGRGPRLFDAIDHARMRKAWP